MKIQMPSFVEIEINKSKIIKYFFDLSFVGTNTALFVLVLSITSEKEMFSDLTY